MTPDRSGHADPPAITPNASATNTPSRARSTAVMTVGTLLSRVTGVIRLAVMASALGLAETRLADSYNLANTAPNILYEVVLGGIAAAALVPLFVELRAKESPERAWEVMSAILNIALIVMTTLALVGVILAPWIAQFYASRLAGAAAVQQQEVVTFLLRLFIPQVILYGLFFVLAAILNAHRRFGPPTWVVIMNNLVAIGIFVAFRALYGRVTLVTVTTPQLLLLGIGTTLSVAPGAIALIPFVRKLGSYRPTLDLSHPSVRKLFRLSVFLVGFVAANQIGYIVIQWLANDQQGGYSAYIAAMTFFLLPIGLFEWSITTALLPSASEHAVHGRWDRYREDASLGARALLFLMIPSTIGFVVMAGPLVRILLEHGVATQSSTELVSDVLRVLSLSLVPFALYWMLVRAFYSVQDARTPFAINVAVIGLNIAIVIPMFRWYGVQGLAAGQAIAYAIGVIVLGRALSRRIGGLDTRGIARSALRIAIASAVMGAVIALCLGPLENLTGALIVELAGLMLVSIVGAAAYLLAAHLVGVKEVAYVRSLVTRRLKKESGATS